MLSDAVQASRCFQRSQHTQTEPITLNVGDNYLYGWIMLFKFYVTHIHKYHMMMWTSIV